MDSGEQYAIHMTSEMLPKLYMTGSGVAEGDAGVYTFGVLKTLVRVNSDREVVYYRNLQCMSDYVGTTNFEVNEVDGTNFYAFNVDINTEFPLGGFSSSVYVVMDENYKEIDIVNLAANDDPNHTHGAGYLDEHEFRILGKGHYLALSYTPLLVDNLPAGVEGINGTSSAYVWAGIYQEIQDGKAVNEINTADYAELYASSVEGCDYANSAPVGQKATARAITCTPTLSTTRSTPMETFRRSSYRCATKAPCTSSICPPAIWNGSWAAPLPRFQALGITSIPVKPTTASHSMRSCSASLLPLRMQQLRRHRRDQRLR